MVLEKIKEAELLRRVACGLAVAFKDSHFRGQGKWGSWLTPSRQMAFGL
jgi:hypothetical protein